MSRLQKIFAVICLMSVAAGWLTARIKSEGSAQLKDNWERAIDGLDVTRDYDMLEARLKETGFFPLSTTRSAEQDRLRAEAELRAAETPKFPDIIGSSIINGKPRVHLRIAEDEIVTVQSGGVLESGWQLKMVDYDRILAVYGDEEQEFKVTNYNAFEGRADPKSAHDK